MPKFDVPVLHVVHDVLRRTLRVEAKDEAEAKELALEGEGDIVFDDEFCYEIDRADVWDGFKLDESE